MRVPLEPHDAIQVVVGENATIAHVRASAAASSKPVSLRFDVETLSAEEIALFVDLIDEWLGAGRVVHIEAAPQMLAHTLYKVGRLVHSRQLTISVQGTEPYPG